MNNPTLYAQSNPFQMRDASHVLKMHKELTSKLPEVILDIGCGTGDVTTQILAPNCSSQSIIVGVDISPKMVNYARQHNQEKENIHYEILDISGDISDFLEDWEGFTKIFSFYCLHWIKDHKKALENINSLLLKDGKCLLVFVAQCPVFEMYEKMAENPKWQIYMKDVNEYIPRTQNMMQPAFHFTQMMEEAGFSNVDCTTLARSFAFSSTKMLKDSVVAINPFLTRIPNEERDEYITECIKTLSAIKNKEGIVNKNESCCFSYKLIVASATKI